MYVKEEVEVGAEGAEEAEAEVGNKEIKKNRESKRRRKRQRKRERGGGVSQAAEMRNTISG